MYEIHTGFFFKMDACIIRLSCDKQFHVLSLQNSNTSLTAPLTRTNRLRLHKSAFK